LEHNIKKYKINTDWGKTGFPEYPERLYEMVQDAKEGSSGLPTNTKNKCDHLNKKSEN